MECDFNWNYIHRLSRNRPQTKENLSVHILYAFLLSHITEVPQAHR